MTVKEISKRIQSETRRKNNLIAKIDEIKADIRATNKALHFWNQELIRAKKMAKKHAYRVIWTESFTCSKIVEAESEEKAKLMCYDIDDPDTRDFDGYSEWGCVQLEDED